MNVGETIATELRRLQESFAPDELAYLALTSKVEFVVRDRLAFRLYRRFGAGGDLVAREWRRRDQCLGAWARDKHDIPRR